MGYRRSAVHQVQELASDLVSRQAAVYLAGGERPPLWEGDNIVQVFSWSLLTVTTSEWELNIKERPSPSPFLTVTTLGLPFSFS